jgi:hypothetical protein
MSTTRRSGPLDDQGRIVRARAAHVIAEMIVSSQERVSDESHWIPKHSWPDPRLYLDQENRVVRPSRLGTKARLAKLADYFQSQSYGAESPQKWARDITAWLRGTQTVSPDKLKWLALRFKRSWIDAMYSAGYIQHVVALISLLNASDPRLAAVVSAFAFRTWTLDEAHEEQLATLDLFQPHGMFEHALSAIEEITSRTLWPHVPARVNVEDIPEEELRCVFRLCDPIEIRYVAEGSSYPTRAARVACTFLVKCYFANLVSFAPTELRAFVQEVIK